MNTVTKSETPCELQCSQLMNEYVNTGSAFKARTGTQTLSTNKVVRAFGFSLRFVSESYTVIQLLISTSS